MKIEVNGEIHDWVADLEQLLEVMGLSDAHVATALNGEFVPAPRREATPLKAGDRIEILAPMQGLSMDPITLYGRPCTSRLLLGTAGYPSPSVLQQAVRRAGAGIVTVSLRRESAASRGGQAFAALLGELDVQLLPNTAGCHTVKEAVTTAHLSRELFGTAWIKLEVIGDGNSLCPDVFGLVEAARILVGEGFQVFPYTTADLAVADRLLGAGCQVLMPWAAPIGSARGLADPYALRALRAHAPGVPLIVDAGLGRPSHAAAAMELGYDAVLLNTAVAQAGDPVAMAEGFALAVRAGRRAWQAEPVPVRDMAVPSTPSWGQAQLA